MSELDGLAPPVVEWCVRELGARPVEQLFAVSQMSNVMGLRLDNGLSVVIKSRPDGDGGGESGGEGRGRAATCVAVQRALAERGYPCPRPLTGVTVIDGRAVHAEEWRPGGEMLLGDVPEVAVKFAVLLAELVAGAQLLGVRPPLPNPIWVGWDHDEPGTWPVYEQPGPLADQVTLPEHVEETAARVRKRLSRCALPCVIGHADWESQNLRWHGTEPYMVHDWDSLAWQPEAAIVGAAAGAFASSGQPTLAPVASSAAFLEAYQQTRGRAFSAEELEVAWAAGLWPAVHNARAEHFWGIDLIASRAVEDQAATRLALAGA